MWEAALCTKDGKERKLWLRRSQLGATSARTLSQWCSLCSLLSVGLKCRWFGCFLLPFVCNVEENWCVQVRFLEEKRLHLFLDLMGSNFFKYTLIRTTWTTIKHCFGESLYFFFPPQCVSVSGSLSEPDGGVCWRTRTTRPPCTHLCCCQRPLYHRHRRGL